MSPVHGGLFRPFGAESLRVVRLGRMTAHSNRLEKKIFFGPKNFFRYQPVLRYKKLSPVFLKFRYFLDMGKLPVQREKHFAKKISSLANP